MMQKYHLVPEIQNITFEIYPKLVFEATLILEESKQNDLQRPVFLKRKQNEDLLNETKIRESKGKVVRIGDVIQLYHPLTGMFLETSMVRCGNQKQSRLELSKKTSSLVQFKVGSSLSFRKEGSKINVGDEIHLRNPIQ